MQQVHPARSKSGPCPSVSYGSGRGKYRPRWVARETKVTLRIHTSSCRLLLLPRHAGVVTATSVRRYGAPTWNRLCLDEAVAGSKKTPNPALAQFYPKNGGEFSGNQKPTHNSNGAVLENKFMFRHKLFRTRGRHSIFVASIQDIMIPTDFMFCIFAISM